MATKTYFFHPEKKVSLKQGFQMEDENGELIYEAKILTFSLLGASDVEFVNHRTGRTEIHKVGKTVTSQLSGTLEIFTKKSSFKFDGEKIWEYLHQEGIRISSGLAHGKIGMRYEVTYKGDFLATIESTSPNGGNGILTGQFWYNVTTDEEDLDLAFLTAFAIARTDQLLYD